MPWIICNENETLFILRDNSQHFGLTTSIKKAETFKSEQACTNVLNNLPKSINTSTLTCKFKDDMTTPSEDQIKIESYNIDSDISSLLTIIHNLETRGAYLNLQLAAIDKELVDIEHAIEFYTLSASDGYKIYKRMHDTRVKRREIKNELDKINLIRSSIDLQKITKSQTTDKTYIPRIATDLFNNQTKVKI